MGDSAELLRQERDCCLSLLRLRGSGDVPAALTEFLAALVEATNAARGYLELYGSAEAVRPRWTLTHGCTSEQTDEIRAVTSRGIVSAALASGTSLHVPFAAIDDRFATLASVRNQRLEAVLCVPISGASPGVLYLEGKRGVGPFPDATVALVEELAGHLGPVVGQAAHADRDHADPTRPFRARMRLDGIIGKSPALAQVFAQVEPFVGLDVTMLITGASGTGKTQLARAIHDNSQRRTGPFVELNCAAIPEGLIESELFGAMPGAFPGARRTAGKVEAAEGGTLFLDEIGEVPFAAQGKLLQLLQSRQYYALASTRLVTANIRVIAATNADLTAAIDARRFREDLFYRLSVVAVRMPSLAERRADVPVLIDDLLVRIASEHRLAPVAASPRFRAAMEEREWHGNVRQLRHQIEAALIRAAAEGAAQVELRHLPETRAPADQPPTFHEATRQYQRDLLRRELEAANWDIPTVVERLELSRAHVYSLINQFGIVRK